MRWNNRRGVIALEALMGFLLMGVMMSLYLPALTQAYRQLHRYQTISQEWRLFALLVQGWQRQDADWVQATLADHPEVVSFDCQARGCHIVYEGGASYDVAQED